MFSLPCRLTAHSMLSTALDWPVSVQILQKTTQKYMICRKILWSDYIKYTSGNGKTWDRHFGTDIAKYSVTIQGTRGNKQDKTTKRIKPANRKKRDCRALFHCPLMSLWSRRLIERKVAGNQATVQEYLCNLKSGAMSWDIYLVINIVKTLHVTCREAVQDIFWRLHFGHFVISSWRNETSKVVIVWGC